MLIPRFVIGSVHLLLLAKPSFHFIVSDRVVSGIRTLFSLDRKVPGSVASENQPIERKGIHKNSSLGKPKYPILH